MQPGLPSSSTKQRLKRKGIPGELVISGGYLDQVAQAYEHFFFHYTVSGLLVVNTSDIEYRGLRVRYS
jgi:deoxyguanosine kinase